MPRYGSGPTDPSSHRPYNPPILNPVGLPGRPGPVLMGVGVPNRGVLITRGPPRRSRAEPISLWSGMFGR